MDARELLRQYLAQRRELGESEFVLDALSVDAAMKALGVRQPASSSSRAAHITNENWRDALRAAGADPGASRAPLAPPPIAERQLPAPATPVVPAPLTSTTDADGSIIVGSAATELFGGRHSGAATIEELANLI